MIKVLWRGEVQSLLSTLGQPEGLGEPRLMPEHSRSRVRGRFQGPQWVLLELGGGETSFFHNLVYSVYF